MKTSVFVGMSVDGFIARSDDALDWLMGAEGANEPHGFEEFFASVDALLMGRRTYDVVLGMKQWFYGAKPVFVLSHRELPPAPEGAVVEKICAEPSQALQTLAARGFKHVYVDGANVVQSFMREGLIDHMTLTRVPLLIGSGIALFGELGKDIKLKHIATRTIANAAVQSEYAVLKS